MKALILAGGLGTRLRPLTYTRPKALLPIGNVPHIEHVLSLLRSGGVDEVVLTTSYLADAFGDVIASARASGVRVEVAHEDEPLGTAGALKNAEAFVGDATFLAFNGDVLTDIDLPAFVERHRDGGGEATILLTEVDDPSRFGVVTTDERGRVEGFVEKPAREDAPTNLINAGVYVMEPSVLSRIPAGEAYSAERALFPELVEVGSLYAYPAGSYWIDVGTHATYLAANVDAAAGRFSGDLVPAASRGVVAAPDAVVEEGAEVSSACLGPRAIVRRGARVDRAVLLAQAEVSGGAEVKESILGEGSFVGPGVRVDGHVVADGDRVED